MSMLLMHSAYNLSSAMPDSPDSLSGDLLFRAVKSPQTKDTRFMFACEGGADSRSRASGARRVRLDASDNPKSSPVFLL